MCVCGYALVVCAGRVRAPLRAPLRAPRARARGLPEAPAAPSLRPSLRAFLNGCPFFFFFFTVRCRLPFANRRAPGRRSRFCVCVFFCCRGSARFLFVLLYTLYVCFMTVLFFILWNEIIHLQISALNSIGLRFSRRRISRFFFSGDGGGKGARARRGDRPRGRSARRARTPGEAPFRVRNINQHEIISAILGGCLFRRLSGRFDSNSRRRNSARGGRAAAPRDASKRMVRLSAGRARGKSAVF